MNKQKKKHNQNQNQQQGHNQKLVASANVVTSFFFPSVLRWLEACIMQKNLCPHTATPPRASGRSPSCHCHAHADAGSGFGLFTDSAKLARHGFHLMLPGLLALVAIRCHVAPRPRGPTEASTLGAPMPRRSVFTHPQSSNNAQRTHTFFAPGFFF